MKSQQTPRAGSRRRVAPKSPARDTAAGNHAGRHGGIFLHALLENLPVAIYFKDLESRFLCVNSAQAARMHGARPEDLIGTTDFDHFSNEHAQQAFDDEQRIIQTGEPMLDVEEKETWPDGSITWVSTSKLPLHDENRKIIGTFGMSQDITARKKAEETLQIAQKELLEASRLAGMAEIASGVLHNIGNGLNSVNTSAELVMERLENSRVANLGKIAGMLEEHRDDLDRFFTEDGRGRQLPLYIRQLHDLLENERTSIRREIDQLCRHVEHIKAVVAMQQNYAGGSGVAEEIAPAELVEEALQISEISLSRHGICVHRDFEDVPKIRTVCHKVLQILVNFIRNAKYALDETGRIHQKDIWVTVRANSPGGAVVTVRDNGVGIRKDVLPQIFNFGFTTRKEGHGFGLHSSANAAREIGAQIGVKSAGPGKGASFSLEIPAEPPAEG